MSTLKFDDGATQLRLRLICSLLSHRPLLIRNIRSDALESAPGLQPHEASFLRLLDKMTNGTKIEINSTGTQLRFKPGVLLGGEIEYKTPIGADLPLNKGIGWYLEGILPLACFGKEPLNLMMEGITDGLNDMDPSVDYLSSSIIPLMKRFGIGSDDEEDGDRPLQLKVLKRGAAPLGEGRVSFYCPIMSSSKGVKSQMLQSLDFVNTGKIKRIRGKAISCKIPSSSANRVAFSAKGMFHRLLPDVWIHTDTHSPQHPRKNPMGCGPSPSLSMVVSCESTEGVILCAECSLSTNNGTQKRNELPEDLGVRCATLLLEEIRRGGCIDQTAQHLCFLWMCLSSEDVTRVRVGALSKYSICALRLYKEAFGVEFKVNPSSNEEQDKTIIMSCLGTGYRNMAKSSS